MLYGPKAACDQVSRIYKNWFFNSPDRLFAAESLVNKTTPNYCKQNLEKYFTQVILAKAKNAKHSTFKPCFAFGGVNESGNL
jgi:hypothetical protein